jgi:predicted Na+-dependent transporter
MGILRLIVAFAVPIMLGGLVAGIVYQPLAAALRPWLIVFIVTTLALAVMRTDLSTLTAVLRRPGATMVQVIWLLALSPLVMFGVLLLVPVPEALRGPLILYAATAPITSMPAFALLFGLDTAFVLIGVTAAALLSPFTVPATAAIVMGDQISIGIVDLGIRMAMIIGGCYALGLLLRRVFGPRRIAGWSLQLNAIFVVAATLLGMAVIDGIVALALRDLGAMILTVVLLLGVCFLLFLLGMLLFLPAGWTTALGAGLNSGGRNISIVLAVAGATASDALIIVVAAAQIPIFVLPILQKPLIRYIMARQVPSESG